jgi:hypothetical protein
MEVFRCIPIYIIDFPSVESTPDTTEKFDHHSTTGSHKHQTQALKITGIGTVQGLPMLNNSNLYGGGRSFPAEPSSGSKESTTTEEVVAAGLARMCHLIDSLSAILNIPLLHPLFPFEFTECCIAAQGERRYV